MNKARYRQIEKHIFDALDEGAMSDEDIFIYVKDRVECEFTEIAAINAFFFGDPNRPLGYYEPPKYN